MKGWKLCGYCNEIALTLFKIEMVTQHCHPTLQSQHHICDGYLQDRG